MSVKSEKPQKAENFHDCGKICYNGGSGAGWPQEGAGCLKSCISIQERLKDLRVERHLNLMELSAATGISKSALGDYENIDYKEINHGNLVTLAKFYGVSTDYLLCMTENRNHPNTALTELHLSDEMVNLLRSGRINNRLLCEIVTNDKFEKLMTDTEIYIDGHATAHFRDMNEALEDQRLALIGKHRHADGDLYSETLLAAQVEEEDFSAISHIRHGTPFSVTYGKPMSVTLKAHRIFPSQRRWRRKFKRR